MKYVIICKRCNVLFILENICKNKLYCSECAKINNRLSNSRYKKKNRIQILIKEKERYLANSNKIRANRIKYYYSNLSKIRSYSKRYYGLNKLQIIKKVQLWKNQNPEKYKNLRTKITQKRKRDIYYIIIKRLRQGVRRAVNNYAKYNKLPRNRNIYGIDYNSIIEHLKPFPEDLSKYHIDHIIPLCSFELTNIEEVRKAFRPDNHRWLLSKDNLSKCSQDKVLSKRRVNIGT